MHSKKLPTKQACSLLELVFMALRSKSKKMRPPSRFLVIKQAATAAAYTLATKSLTSLSSSSKSVCIPWGYRILSSDLWKVKRQAMELYTDIQIVGQKIIDDEPFTVDLENLGNAMHDYLLGHLPRADYDAIEWHTLRAKNQALGAISHEACSEVASQLHLDQLPPRVQENGEEALSRFKEAT